MPGGNGTGPNGMGPMTGRGAGFCAGFNVPGYANPAVGGGPGMGRGRGFGRGMGGGGRGMGRRAGFGGFNPQPAAYQTAGYQPPVLSNEQQVEYLKQQAEYAKQNLSEIESRIKDLEK